MPKISEFKIGDITSAIYIDKNGKRGVIILNTNYEIPSGTFIPSECISDVIKALRDYRKSLE